MQRVPLRPSTFSAPRRTTGPEPTVSADHEFAFTVALTTWTVIAATAEAQRRFGTTTIPCSVDAILSPSSGERLGQVTARCLQPGESWRTEISLGPSCPPPHTLRVDVNIYGTTSDPLATITADHVPEVEQGLIDITDTAVGRELLLSHLRVAMETAALEGVDIALIVTNRPSYSEQHRPSHGDGRQDLSFATQPVPFDDGLVGSIHRVRGRNEALAVAKNLSVRADRADVARPAGYGADVDRDPNTDGTEPAGSGDASRHSVGVTLAFDPSEAAETVLARAVAALEKAKTRPKANIVIAEQRTDSDTMATRIPINPAAQKQSPSGATKASTATTAAPTARPGRRPIGATATARATTTTSVRRTRIDHSQLTPSPTLAPSSTSQHSSPSHRPFLVPAPTSRRIAKLAELGWGPLRPTVDLGAPSPLAIGINGKVPNIEPRDAARQLLQAATNVEPGALPFSAKADAESVPAFLAAAAQVATVIDVTRHAVGIEIDASAVRALDFSGVESLRALHQEGLAITIGQLDPESAHRSFFEAAAARVVAIDISGMSKDRMAQMITIATHSDIAVIADGVHTREDLQMVTDAGCRYAQGDLFIFAEPDDA